MEFFDETKLNDDFVSKFEKCIPSNGIDVHLIATVVYKLLQTFITHVQKQSLFVGLTSFIKQIESKEWLEQNGLDLLTLEARGIRQFQFQTKYMRLFSLIRNVNSIGKHI
jgi:hypothetical protein